MWLFPISKNEENLKGPSFYKINVNRWKSYNENSCYFLNTPRICRYVYYWQHRKCINCILWLKCIILLLLKRNADMYKHMCMYLWGLQIVNKAGQLIFVRMHHKRVISAAALNTHCINLSMCWSSFDNQVEGKLLFIKFAKVNGKGYEINIQQLK